jgi:5'-methylthioadenosine phosphorylase
MSQVRIGIIGGTGLGDALGALGGELVEIDTPYGPPAAPIRVTRVDGVEVALLSRHGMGHRVNPTHVPYRANVFALKALGVTHVIASGATGSLHEDIAPRHLVVADQIIDRTFRRVNTFFDDFAGHVDFASPFCPTLRRLLNAQAGAVSTTVHPSGTYVCIEGPQLSSQAESRMHRLLGGHLVGMTALPEARLMREAEICYALVALPTDYDCWRARPEEAASVDVLSEVIANLRAATDNGLALIRSALPHITGAPCTCQSALSKGIWSAPETIDAEVRRRLAPLLKKYLPVPS